MSEKNKKISVAMGGNTNRLGKTKNPGETLTSSITIQVTSAQKGLLKAAPSGNMGDEYRPILLTHAEKLMKKRGVDLRE